MGWAFGVVSPKAAPSVVLLASLTLTSPRMQTGKKTNPHLVRDMIVTHLR